MSPIRTILTIIPATKLSTSPRTMAPDPPLRACVGVRNPIARVCLMSTRAIGVGQRSIGASVASEAPERLYGGVPSCLHIPNQLSGFSARPRGRGLGCRATPACVTTLRTLCSHVSSTIQPARRNSLKTSTWRSNARCAAMDPFSAWNSTDSVAVAIRRRSPSSSPVRVCYACPALCASGRGRALTGRPASTSESSHWIKGGVVQAVAVTVIPVIDPTVRCVCRPPTFVSHGTIVYSGLRAQR